MTGTIHNKIGPANSVSNLAGNEVPPRPVSGAVRRNEFEHFLVGLSNHFIGLDAQDVEREVQGAFAQIGAHFEVDRVAIGEFSRDLESVTVTHSWSPPGVTPVPVRALLRKAGPEVFARIRRGEVVTVPDTSKIPEDWNTERESFRRSGAKSHLSIPISVGDARIGLFSVSTVHEPREWPRPEIERLTLVAQVFANGLYRRGTERKLRKALARVRELNENLRAENTYLREEVDARHDYQGIVGQSPQLQGALATAEQVAPVDVTVLIQGETGTGKDLIARAVHARSKRSARSLIKVNCSAIPDSLAESELFGHEKGAFTGAISRQTGRFELAHKGTIFLDEIADMSLEIQSKLLRVLQDGEFERLGSGVQRAVDVRVIAATSRDLEQAVEQGEFRADLYYRLRVVPIEMPALRRRREDIPLLVWHFVQRAREKHGRAAFSIPPQTMDALTRYDWPGNVRELENVIERAVVLSNGRILEVRDSLIMNGHSRLTPPAGETNLDAVERAHVVSVLAQCDWKVKGPGNAADQLGLNPSTLRGRMQKLGIARPS